MANKAIKYRLYPTKEQEEWFQKTFGCCRKIYNLMLSDKIAYYKETGKKLQTTPAQYKTDYPYLKEVDSLALANVQLHLQTAYQNFFQNKNIGFPTFKSAKRSRKSYTTNNQKGSISLQKNGVKLPKIGIVKAKIHREPESNWKLKSATISQERDGTYYVSVLFSYEKEIVLVSKDSTNAIGLDYKSDGLYMDSHGTRAKMPKYYRKQQKKLAKEQRKLARRIGSKKGESKSSNYKKQQQKIAKMHRHIANQRQDYLHKKSTEIANQYDVVCVESLHMRAMSNRGFGNGKATLDNGYGYFLEMLEYKLADRGKYFVKVDKWYPSSQLCSGCGKRKKLGLEERVYECSCGLKMDRDYNAAINIRREGQRILREEME